MRRLLASGVTFVMGLTDTASRRAARLFSFSPLPRGGGGGGGGSDGRPEPRRLVVSSFLAARGGGRSGVYGARALKRPKPLSFIPSPPRGEGRKRELISWPFLN